MSKVLILWCLLVASEIRSTIGTNPAKGGAALATEDAVVGAEEDVGLIGERSKAFFADGVHVHCLDSRLGFLVWISVPWPRLMGKVLPSGGREPRRASPLRRRANYSREL